MHPILFRIPLPGWSIPLFPTLLVIAVAGALLGVFGWRKKVGDLLVIGVVLAIGCGIAAFSLKGRTYALSELPIYSYGAMLCLSLVVGWFLTLGLAERDGLPKETVANCYFITAVGALVGARLLYVITNPDEFHTLADLVNLRRGGMVAYGGFLGGFLASLGYLRMHKLRLLPWADVAVPSLASGLLLTRIGCYLFGCDFGKPLSEGAPGWLKRMGTFPHWPDGTLPEGAGSPAWIQHVNSLGLAPDSEASLPVHPTQLYESLAGAALLALVFTVRRRQSFRGQVFFAFTFAYGVIRFLIEIVRDDAERGEFGPHLPDNVYYLLALLGFAAAFCYGPARSITNERIRRIAQALSIVPAIIVYFAMKPPSFAAPTIVQLSTSQWIGLLTGIAVAVAWSAYAQAAELHPEAAMRLSLHAGGDAELETEAAGAARESDEALRPSRSEKPRKKRRKRRETHRETPISKRGGAGRATSDESAALDSSESDEDDAAAEAPPSRSPKPEVPSETQSESESTASEPKRDVEP